MWTTVKSTSERRRTVNRSLEWMSASTHWEKQPSLQRWTQILVAGRVVSQKKKSIETHLRPLRDSTNSTECHLDWPMHRLHSRGIGYRVGPIQMANMPGLHRGCDHIYTSIKQHIIDVDRVLIALANSGISLRLKQCHFFMDRVKYLGHVIRPGRI